MSWIVFDSYILIPNHTMVNNEAVGGNHAANAKIPVEAAAISTTSLPSCTVMSISYSAAIIKASSSG